MKRLGRLIIAALALTILSVSRQNAACVSAASDAELADRVYLSGGNYFDKETEMYVYVVEEAASAEVSCSVADGMLVNGPVRIGYNPIFPIMLYKDGSEVTPDWNRITDPGTYLVKIMSNGSPYNVLGFTIVGEYTSLTQYSLPDGCSVSLCTLNEKEIVTDIDVVALDQEGVYHVEYRNSFSKMTHSFTTCVDHTAPTLTLEGVVDGRAKGAVSIGDVDSQDEIFVTLDGKHIVPEDSKLRTIGKYYIRVTDPAGNSTEYEFEIVVSLDFYTILFLIAFAILIVGLVVYLMIGRRKMKVR